MNKIKDIFIKIGKAIKKFWSATINFFKESPWASTLAIVVGILLFIFIVQGVVKGVDKCNNKNSETAEINKAITLTSTEVMEKINNNETFILFMGSHSCAHCKQFYKTINTYVDSGNTVYYIDLDDTSDPTRTRYLPILQEKLVEGIPADRAIEDLSTPTTVYVKDGEFVDAVQGAYGMEGGTNYAIFCDVMEGKYIGKPTYKFVTATK